MNNEDNGFLSASFQDMMSIIGFAIGLYNMQLNERSLSNEDVAKEVQANRQKLDEQNDTYLVQILKNQEKIISLLEGGKRNEL